MDPWQVYRLLKPLEKYNYKLVDILYIVYPLKGKWRWEHILKCGDEDIKKLFSDVHNSKQFIKLGSGGHIIEEWGVDTDYNNTLYKKLYVFFKGDEDDISSTSSIEESSTSSGITLGDLDKSIKEKIDEQINKIRDGQTQCLIHV